MIENIFSSKIEITNQKKNDLSIVFPHVVFDKSFIKRNYSEKIKNKIMNKKTVNLEEVLGIDPQKSLFVSFENLDHEYYKIMKNLILNSKVPRLTSWPTLLDPFGIRFPYWWNFVIWPNFNFPVAGNRGIYYEIEKLTNPIKREKNKLNRAIYLSNHKHWPRDNILKNLEKKIKIDTHICKGSLKSIQKKEIIQNYRFVISTENSVGYGYETEKIPDAWVLGCIPIGVWKQPFGDFNQRVLTIDDLDNKYPFKESLVTEDQLGIGSVFSYLGSKLNI